MYELERSRLKQQTSLALNNNHITFTNSYIKILKSVLCNNLSFQYEQLLIGKSFNLLNIN